MTAILYVSLDEGMRYVYVSISVPDHRAQSARDRPRASTWRYQHIWNNDMHGLQPRAFSQSNERARCWRWSGWSH